MVVTVIVESNVQQTMQYARDDLKNKNKNTDMENGVTDIAALFGIDVHKIIH